MARKAATAKCMAIYNEEIRNQKKKIKKRKERRAGGGRGKKRKDREIIIIIKKLGCKGEKEAYQHTNDTKASLHRSLTRLYTSKGQIGSISKSGEEKKIAYVPRPKPSTLLTNLDQATNDQARGSEVCVCVCLLDPAIIFLGLSSIQVKKKTPL